MTPTDATIILAAAEKLDARPDPHKARNLSARIAAQCPDHTEAERILSALPDRVERSFHHLNGVPTCTLCDQELGGHVVALPGVSLADAARNAFAVWEATNRTSEMLRETHECSAG